MTFQEKKFLAAIAPYLPRIKPITSLSTQKYRVLTLALCSLFLLFANAATVLADPEIGDAISTEESDTASLANLTGCGGARLPSSNPDYEARVVELVNQIRLEHGLLPLKRVAQLDHAARFHATDMAVDDYFAHNSHDRVNGQLVLSCKWGDRVSTYYANWSSMSENIGAGYTSPDAVVKGWMESEGHRKNILSNANWEIGVGYFSGQGSYKHYWVQNFGQRRDTYPVIINGEAATTDTGELTIHVYGQWENIRMRANVGAWSEWQPFQPVVGWFLEGAPGEHTLHVEMRKAGTVAHSSDTIRLTTDTTPSANNNLQNKIYLPSILGRR
jgi:uncharacterized protein YkwD